MKKNNWNRICAVIMLAVMVFVNYGIVAEADDPPADTTRPTVTFSAMGHYKDDYYTESDLFSGSPQLNINISDNVGIKSYSIDVEGPNSITGHKEKTFETTQTLEKYNGCSIKDFITGTVVDGSYKFTIQVTDTSGNTLETPFTKTITIDSYKPKLEYATNIGGIDKLYPDNTDATGIDYYTAGATHEEKYSALSAGFVFSDATSGIEYITYSISNASDSSKNVSNVSYTSGAMISFPTSKDRNGTKIDFSVHDNAGNTASYTYSFCVDGEPAKVSNLKIDDENYTASGSVIKSIDPVITGTVTDNLAIKRVRVIVKKPDGTSVTKDLETEAFFEGKTNYNINCSFSSLGITDVVDGEYEIKIAVNDTTYEEDGNICDPISVVIDNTAPVIESISDGTITHSDMNTVVSTLGPSVKSYNNLTIGIIAEDSDGYSTNAGLGKVTVTYEAAGETKTATFLAGETVSVDIPESQNAAGTPVSVKVEDALGNAREYTGWYFLVDKTSPEVSLKVNSNEVTGVECFSGDPTINANVDDNFNIDFAKLQITAPDSTDVNHTEATYYNGDNALSSLLSSTPKDGKYTIKLSANDGLNTPDSTKQVEFILDNSKPVVNKISIDGTDYTPTTISACESANKEYKNVSIKLGVTDVVNGTNDVSGIKSIKVEQIGATTSTQTFTEEELGTASIDILPSATAAGTEVKVTVTDNLDQCTEYTWHFLVNSKDSDNTPGTDDENSGENGNSTGKDEDKSNDTSKDKSNDSSNAGNKADVNISSPKTGDGSVIWFWVLMMIAGLGMFGFTMYFEKKHNNE